MGSGYQQSTWLRPFALPRSATIHVHPVMTPEDLGKATPAIEQAAQKYG